tara:strand:+ start:728 stop:1306 length:579 start_codon:yes stop_codon:yes gene_type:complete
MNLKELSTDELFYHTKNLMRSFYKQVRDLYPELDEEHLDIKVYQSIDRVKMYLATHICDCTFYDFDIENYRQKRKVLIKIINFLNSTNYAELRTIWHSELKDIFYQQKEYKKQAESIANTCIVVRNISQNAFVTIKNGKFTTTPKIHNAVEFIIHSKEQSELERVENLLKEYFPLDNLQVFFNQKMIGRNFY